MSDKNLSLPVRTENNSDVVSAIADATNISQTLIIDVNGRAAVKDASDGSVAPGVASDNASLIGGHYNSTLPTLANGEMAAVQVDSKGRLLVANATHADFNANVRISDASGDAIENGQKTMANSLPVVIASDQTNIKVNHYDGAGNAITSQSNGSQRALDVGINVAGVQVDPRAIRPLVNTDVVSANIRDESGVAYSGTNPLPVTLVDIAEGSTEVLQHNTTVNLAAGSSATYTKTITVGKTFVVQSVMGSASGKIKMEVQIGLIGAAVNKVVMFNSVSEANAVYNFKTPQRLADTFEVKVVITNYDKQAQDVYCTIEGYEI